MRLPLVLTFSAALLGGCSLTLRAPLPKVEVDEMHRGPYAGGACMDASNYQLLRAKLAILEKEAGR